MSKGEEFTVTWHCDDGYVGKDRPHQFEIDAEDVADLDDDGLETLFDDMLQEAFANTCSPASSDLDDFIAWAKRIQEK